MTLKRSTLPKKKSYKEGSQESARVYLKSTLKVLFLGTDFSLQFDVFAMTADHGRLNVCPIFS
jgi:hypothetical protein